MLVKDYIIKKAKCVDGRKVDIYVKDGIICDIQDNIELDVPQITFGEDYVSAGWIDVHTHCFDKFEIYGDQPDLIGFSHGVCSVIDAGTAGSDTIDEFYQQAEKSKTRVYSLLNISSPGIFAQDELSDLKRLEKDKIKKYCHQYAGFILGLKARMSKSVLGNSGNQPLIFANEIKKEVQLPLMVHIGSAPSLLEDIVNLLDENDIMTHVYNPKENGIVKDGTIKECVYQAKEKGIYFDLGHGTDSFSFHVAKIAMNNQIDVDTISTDIYFRNRENGPVYDLPTTMTKMLYVGYSLQKVIDCVTKNAAHMFNLSMYGEIAVGKKADFTVFRVNQGEKELRDSTGLSVITNSYIQPTHVIVKDCLYNLEEI